MILILSKSTHESTTEAVMDWLAHLGLRCVRLNGADVDAAGAVTLRLDGAHAGLQVDGEALSFRREDVRVVWGRRWGQEWRHRAVDPFLAPAATAQPERLYQQIVRHLDGELDRLSDVLFALFDEAAWLTHPGTATPNKLVVLQAAARAGLETPATLVTGDRAHLEPFFRQHGPLITKAIGETRVFVAGGRAHVPYTAALDRAALDALPERFFPTLFQERLPKAYEVRVFYLDGDCYSMAIFSQLDAQTTVDFRRYNEARPNRCVPYRLPEPVSAAAGRLMRALGMETGSLDLVRTPDGRHVFLEVNPAGQFAMVSEPCNYHLERRVADSLARRAHHEPS